MVTAHRGMDSAWEGVSAGGNCSFGCSLLMVEATIYGQRKPLAEQFLRMYWGHLSDWSRGTWIVGVGLPSSTTGGRVSHPANCSQICSEIFLAQ